MDVSKEHTGPNKKRILSSSIAEVVVAIALIAMCFGIAATIFVRSLSSTMRFSGVNEQTKEQLRVFERLQGLDVLEENSGSLQMDSVLDLRYKDVVLYTIYGSDRRIVWQQQLPVVE